MKNSGVEWIGEIPDEWEVKKLKYICDPLASGGTPDSNNDQYYCENGTNWVAINDMSLVDYVENTAKHITNLAINEKKLKIYPKGTIIYSIYATLGHVAELSKPACINQALLALSIKDKSFNKSYFKYSLNAMREYVLAFSSGNTQFNLNAQKVRNFTLLTPSFETQQRIASYLDKKCNKIEETIQKQQQVIEKLKAYKQSLITEAVTGKIKIQNGKVCGKYESYKDSGVEWIGKIPKGWEVIKLKFSSQIMRGLFSHRPRNDPDYYDGVHPFIQTGEVARAVKYITTYSQTLNELGFSVSREFPAGTVLLTIAANVGDVAILDFNACFPDSVIGFYPKENVSKIFMFYVLKSMKEQFMRNAIISTQMNLNINIVKEEFIPLPSLAEQKEIVKFLEKKSDYIDTAIEQKQNLIEKLTEYKKSLIYECVTGKKEI